MHESNQEDEERSCAGTATRCSRALMPCAMVREKCGLQNTECARCVRMIEIAQWTVSEGVSECVGECVSECVSECGCLSECVSECVSACVRE